MALFRAAKQAIAIVHVQMRQVACRLQDENSASFNCMAKTSLVSGSVSATSPDLASAPAGDVKASASAPSQT